MFIKNKGSLLTRGLRHWVKRRKEKEVRERNGIKWLFQHAYAVMYNNFSKKKKIKIYLLKKLKSIFISEKKKRREKNIELQEERCVRSDIKGLLIKQSSCQDVIYLSDKMYRSHLPDAEYRFETSINVEGSLGILLIVSNQSIPFKLKSSQIHQPKLHIHGHHLIHFQPEIIVETSAILVQALERVMLAGVEEASVVTPFSFITLRYCLSKSSLYYIFLLTVILGTVISFHKSQNKRKSAVNFSGWYSLLVVNFAVKWFQIRNLGNQHDKMLKFIYLKVINCIATVCDNFLSQQKTIRQTSEWSQCCDFPFMSIFLFVSCCSFIDELRVIENKIHYSFHLYLLESLYRCNDSRLDFKQFRIDSMKLCFTVSVYFILGSIFSSVNALPGPKIFLFTNLFYHGLYVHVGEATNESLILDSINKAETFSTCYHSLLNFFKHKAFEKMQKQVSKDGPNKWVNVLHKFAGRSRAATDCTDFNSSHTEPSRPNDDSSDIWDIEPMRNGPQGIPKDMFAMLHLFCATYSHLLLVLDDIEFYEKQVPFQIEQQRKIASMLNTLVYNGLSHVGGHHNKSLMDCAIRCLHLLYERDCRHPFCPPALWLSPARKSRPPIAVAARTHEVLAANLIHDDYSSASLSVGSVVTIVPHVFPFEERVEIFREFIKMDKASRKMAGEISEPGSRAIEIVIRRGHIVEDGFRQLNSLGSRLKSSIHVSFVSECGLLEAGLDYGGLSKEFLTDLSKAAFAPEYGLFSQTSTSDRLLIPTASARYLENGLQMIEFLGRVVGKALYEGILLDYSFSHVFVQKLLGRYSFLDELSTLDPELYRNLMYVKNYDGDVTELCLDFTVTEESLGKRYVVELKSGGKDISVTNENKMQYMHAMADYKLNQQMLPFSNAFYRGLTDLISPSWLKLFNASEFNQLLSGGNYDIDVDDLKNNTRYTGGYNEGSRTIKIFWEVIKGFEPQERCMLLKFVTSCSRAPLLGFKYLQPPLTIHKVACDVPLWATIGGQDVDRLPSASTCYNTLKLPTYKRPGTLRAKLLYAISSNAGFELS
ncbi:E3 ubiquitin-protein [Vigna angularis]|uniref:HECT-type E3 ubiquitin transferase n=1 Tax=Phaseolus angularis TaxID=3914 RepID=A0A8T0L1T8_PHAAN|nr:E3 ubiquitin-protein [Vigna angularis]